MKDKVFENWDAKKEHIKKIHPELTDDDLVYKAGQEMEVLERLQKKLKKSKDEVSTLLSYIGYA
jgi:uncharacterized protein YjbJ (UPF0337 family)